MKEIQEVENGKKFKKGDNVCLSEEYSWKGGIRGSRGPFVVKRVGRDGISFFIKIALVNGETLFHWWSERFFELA